MFMKFRKFTAKEQKNFEKTMGCTIPEALQIQLAMEREIQKRNMLNDADFMDKATRKLAKHEARR